MQTTSSIKLFSTIRSIMIACCACYFLLNFPRQLRITTLQAAEKSTQLQYQNDPVQNADIVVGFQGKGSSIAFDAGIIEAAYHKIPALQNNEVIVTGSSSGSVIGAYFACHGFTPESVQKCSSCAISADVKSLMQHEDVGEKTLKILRGEKTELSHEVLKEYIALALGMDAKKYKTIAELRTHASVTIKLPIVIVAANAEVLSNRDLSQPAGGLGLKTFHTDNFSVEWTKNAFESYRENPDLFAKQHPNLRLDTKPLIGKACTYFVDQKMYDLLSKIPFEQRLGDLRLMRTGEDLIMAIMATCSEPTYFDPIEEVDYSKLSAGPSGLGDRGNSKVRLYCGGFVMSLVAQDVRRSLPEVSVFATGCAPIPRSANFLLKSWYLVDAQNVQFRHNWWSDFMVQLSDENDRKIAAKKLTSAEQHQLGKASLEYSIENKKLAPRYYLKPDLRTPISQPVSKLKEADQVSETKDGEDLVTMRGLPTNK